jgi:regulatory protein
MKEMTENDAMMRLSALCSQAEHCVWEMRQKMQRWGLPEEMQDRVLQYLTEEKYVDEERYCRAFAHDKIRYNKWGRRKVEAALMAKRIPREIFQTVLDEVDDEEYLKVLRPLLETRRRQLKGLDGYALNSRLFRFAAGRGFTTDIIRKCLDDDGWQEDDADDEFLA